VVEKSTLWRDGVPWTVPKSDDDWTCVGGGEPKLCQDSILDHPRTFRPLPPFTRDRLFLNRKFIFPMKLAKRRRGVEIQRQLSVFRVAIGPDFEPSPAENVKPRVDETAELLPIRTRKGYIRDRLGVFFLPLVPLALRKKPTTLQLWFAQSGGFAFRPTSNRVCRRSVLLSASLVDYDEIGKILLYKPYHVSTFSAIVLDCGCKRLHLGPATSMTTIFVLPSKTLPTYR